MAQKEEEYLARYAKLSEEEKMLIIDGEAWSVINQINWFEPTRDPFHQRYWFWWDAQIKYPSHIVVIVDAVDLPFPSGSLEWLMGTSGGIKFEEADFVN